MTEENSQLRSVSDMLEEVQLGFQKEIEKLKKETASQISQLRISIDGANITSSKIRDDLSKLEAIFLKHSHQEDPKNA